MKRVDRLRAMSSAGPDDVLVTCASFEDRCLGLTKLGEDYRSRSAFVIRYTAAKAQSAIDRRRQANAKELCEYLGRRAEKVREVLVSRYNPFELELELDDLWELSGTAVRHVTVDMSCFTRVQLVYFLLRLLRIPHIKVRLLYSRPLYYASARNRPFAGGSDGMLFLPFESHPVRMAPIGADNVLIAALGHEGERTLVAWRLLDPVRTVLLLPWSKEAPDLTRTAEKENAQLLERIACGDTTTTLRRVSPTSIGATVKALTAAFEDLEMRDKEVSVALMPGGPKPVVAALVIAAMSTGMSSYIAYPLVAGYDPAYSSGFSDMLSWGVRRVRPGAVEVE
jgi:hypothetical protein